MSDPEIVIIPFMAEDLIRLQGTEIAPEARLKHVSGNAVSVFLDDELLCCAGIQTEGIGEAWACFSEEIKKKLTLNQKCNTLERCAAELEGIMRVHRIWRLWSENPDTEMRVKFIKHLGFHKIEAYTRG